MGVPSYVGGTTAALTAAGTGPMTINVHGSEADGDLMLLTIGVGSGAGVPSISGSPFVLIGRTGSARGYLYARLASSEPASYDINLTLSSEAAATLDLYRPSSGSWASLGDAIASILPRLNQSASTHDVSELPMAQCDHRLYASVVVGRGSTTTTEPSGYTARGNPDSGGTSGTAVEIMSADLSVSNGLAPATTFATSNGAASVTFAVAIVDPSTNPRALRSARSTGLTVASTAYDMECGLTAAGDQLVAVIVKTGSTITPPAGWTAAVDQQWNSTNDRYAVFTKDAAAVGNELGTTFGFTQGASSSSIVGWLYAFANTGPVVVAHAVDSTTDTTIVTPALTMAAQSPQGIVVDVAIVSRGDVNVTAVTSGYAAIHTRGTSGNATGVIASGGASGDVRAACAFDVTSGSNPAAGAWTQDSTPIAAGIKIGTSDVAAPTGYGYPVLAVG